MVVTTDILKAYRRIAYLKWRGN